MVKKIKDFLSVMITRRCYESGGFASSWTAKQSAVNRSSVPNPKGLRTPVKSPISRDDGSRNTRKVRTFLRVEKPLFGTNGVRGIANVEIVPMLALRLGKSLGTYLKRNLGLVKPRVAVGRDTRVSGEMLKSATIAGLLSTGCEVTDIGIAPTPGIQYYVRGHADAGIVITASHNPKEYNGLKLIAGDGTEFSRIEEKKVEDIYYSESFHQEIWSRTGNFRVDSSALEEYKLGILEAVDAGAIRSRRFRIVVDTGCGAGSLVTPFLLRELGCEVISLNAQIDGTFPGRPPEPTEDVLSSLMEMVKSCRADAGFAHDGDADRLAVIDENGEFINEEVLLAMMAKHVLGKKKGTIVTPVSSSLRIADVARENGGELVWTPVGSIDVARKMMEKKAIFGGEGNGGLIFPEHLLARDGAMAAAKILEIMAKGKKLSELAGEIPYYYNLKTKIHCQEPDQIMEAILKEFRGEKIDTMDGIKVWFEDGWLLIRPSGTEPLIRVFAESKNAARAKELMEMGRKMVEGYR